MPTTCSLLNDSGWKIHAVRLTTTLSSWLNSPLELLDVQYIGSAARDSFDLLRILDSVAGGRPFYADISDPDSPFMQIRQAPLSSGLPPLAAGTPVAFAARYDAILHIPSGASGQF